MPDNAPIVEPLDPNAQQTATVQPNNPDEQEQGQPQSQDSGLPPALLKLPVMQALISGAPPAVSVSIKGFANNPDAKLMVENKPALLKAGIGFYRSTSGDTGVIFNLLHVHPADIQAADRAGKLTSIAPPITQVEHAVAKSGYDNPVLARNGVPPAPAPQRSVAPPQMASGRLPTGSAPAAAPTAPQIPIPMRPPPAGLQNQALRAKLAGLNPGAPTSGPSPGSGRLLNSILRPAV